MSTTGRDLAVAGFALLAGSAVVAARAAAGLNRVPWGWELAAQVAAAAVLVVGRARHAAGPTLLITAVLSWVSPTPVIVLAAFDVGRAAGRASTAWVGTGAVLAAAGSWFAFRRPDAEFAAVLALLVIGGWLAGRGRHAEDVAAAARRRESALAQSRLVDETRQAERARLAREMHDVVAHRISYLVLQANVLQTHLDDPARIEEVRGVRDTARAALDEMRQVLALLRETGPDEDERTSLADLDVLLDEARGIGQPVTAEITVAPGDVPDVVERTAVRIVGEAVTNAVKHAPGAATRVQLRTEGPDLHIRVSNDPGTATPTDLTTGGNGLRGIAERVALVGGRVRSGPTPQGGWTLDALIPRETVA